MNHGSQPQIIWEFPKNGGTLKSFMMFKDFPWKHQPAGDLGHRRQARLLRVIGWPVWLLILGPMGCCTDGKSYGVPLLDFLHAFSFLIHKCWKNASSCHDFSCLVLRWCSDREERPSALAMRLSHWVDFKKNQWIMGFFEFLRRLPIQLPAWFQSSLT